jgi:hypothetical protein
MGVSSDWNGAINVGTGCNSAGSCATGGPNWDGRTPFSRAEINFWGNPGKVWYDISQVCLRLHVPLCASCAVLTRLACQIYGFNVGMKITTGDGSCPGFACGQLWNGCPVPGPSVAGQWNSCFSGCCSSAGACANGALPAGGGGCTQNAGPGPHSSFFYNNCPNAYAFPDNDGTRRAWFSAWSSVLTRFVGAAGYSPANFVDYTCGNTDVTLTLCPGGSSHYSK